MSGKIAMLMRKPPYATVYPAEGFRAMLTAMERDQFNEKRSNRLRDFILDDQELLVELIGSADLEIIKDLTRALQLSPSFADMDKRSLLARIVKSYPAIQVLISAQEGPHFALRKFAMQKGGGMPRHTNRVEHEQYVLGGRARVRIGDETFEAGAGDVLLIPAGAPHSYETLGDEAYSFLCLVPKGEDCIEVLSC